MSKDPMTWRPQASFNHRITTRRALDEVNGFGGMAVTFEPPNQAVHIAVAGSQSEALSVWTTTSRTGFLSLPKFDSELVTVRFVDRGILVRANSDGRNHVVGVGQAILTAFDVMRCERATTDFSSISATFQRSTIIAACRSIFGDRNTPLPLMDNVVDLSSHALQTVRASLKALQSRLSYVQSCLDYVTPLMVEVLLYQLISSWPISGVIEPLNHDIFSKAAIRRALEFIHSNLTTRVTVQEIAKAADLSVRSLQSHFKQELGCTPIDYLLEKRLDAVQIFIHSGDAPSVSAAAKSWGFVHMGDFAARYRRRFGRVPSDEYWRNG